MAIFNSKLLVITRGFSAISARGLRPTWPCVVEDLKGHVPASASVAKPMEFPAVHPQQSWNRWDLWWFTMILWWYYDDFLMILWRFVMILWWFLRMIFELRPSQLWYIAFDPSPSGLLLALQTALSIHLDSQRDSNEMMKSIEIQPKRIFEGRFRGLRHDILWIVSR